MTPSPVRDHVIEVDGIRTPVLEAGPAGADEAVVFVHGNPGPRDDWRRLVGAVGPFARALAWDHPGYGAADRPAGFDYTVAGYARHIDRVLAALDVTRVHLVLHDFGGMWGLQWAADHPDRLASVVLVNTGVLLDYRWHTLARVWRTPVLGEVFTATTPKWALRMVVNHNEPRPLPREFFDDVLPTVDRGYNRAVLRLYRSLDDPSGLGRRLADALRPLDRPALVVWGAHDAYLPVRLAEAQRAAFPRAEVEILADSGHWPHVDAPETVEPLITGFLQRHVTAATAER